jgi:replicative DNA helicase
MSLQAQLADFLAEPDTAMKLFNERFNIELLTDQEFAARQVLEFQFEHIKSYGKAASREVLEDRFKNITFTDPDCELGWLVDEFRTRYAKKQAESLIIEFTKGIKNPSEVHEAIQKAYKSLSVIKDKVRKQSIILRTGDYSFVFEERRKRLEAMGGANVGVSFGFQEIDDHLGGIKKGELVFVIGRPKRYKSWMLIKSAVAAQKSGKKVAFFTLEMPKEEMFSRYACMTTSIPWNRYQKGNLSTKEWEVMEKKFSQLEEELYMVRPPRGERTVDHIRSIARELEADIIYIDQLKFIEYVGKNGNQLQRTERIDYICEELKDLADEFPIYIACQFNREAESMKEMGDLSKIGLSDSIGQTADTLLGLYQNKAMKNDGILQFGIIDSRSYDHGLWELSVDLSTNSNFRLVHEIEGE